VAHNPFVYGHIVRGDRFADRTREIRELMSDLSRGQNVIIFSPRRFGKTSLILEILDRLKAQGVVTVYVDLYRVTSKGKFLGTMAKAIAKGYTGKIEQIVRDLKNLLPRVIPKVVVKTEDAPEIEFSYDMQVDADTLLDDLLEAVSRRVEKSDGRAVVVFDEFQELTTWDDGEVERAMRSHFQLHERVAYVFMGSKQHLMTDIFRNKNRPFYRFGKHFPLGKIPVEEFATFILQKFHDGGFVIGEAAVLKILTQTEAHPYYTQLLCNVLWDRCHDTKQITQEAVEEAVEEVIDRESHAYNMIWDHLPIMAKRLLEAMAVDPSSRIYSAEFLARHHLGPPSSLQRAIGRLQREEIIEREDDTYMFTDIFFKRWIERRVE
jgi:hypothetical protein